ncbi:hypothetical protein [Pedobacter punctiformis]|uniref:Uncharacterized protein n=1 Tax=Pedobacter punctiformis TaxID=3004097 RepID=A0ABT4LAL1_9SPHI|nr:hypothetical protein [Pedobacter sp. HCMS5-2]MCZ4244939.1 hypothetical protein [Pedobacter sp. HCMS5-2]
MKNKENTRRTQKESITTDLIISLHKILRKANSKQIKKLKKILDNFSREIDRDDDYFYERMDLVLKHFDRKQCDSFLTTSQIMEKVQRVERVKPLDPIRTGMLLTELFGEPVTTIIKGRKQKVYHVKPN